MKLGTLTVTAGLLAVGMITLIAPGKAQGPLWDVVHVNLPYTVVVGDRTLEPGEYTIQQNHDSGGGAKILLIYSDKGMKFETSAMTIPALDPKTPRETKVILSRLDTDYYLDKVWIQGKDYGYEFPMPDKIKSREKERNSVSVAARYGTSTQSSDTTIASTSVNTDQNRPATSDTANNADQNRTAADLNAANTAATQPSQPVTSPADSVARTDVPVDQGQTLPSNPPQTTTPSTASSRTSVDSSANSANRSIEDQTPAATPSSSTPDRMPSTSAGWLMMVLGGGSLSGLGLALRRKR